MYTIKDFWGNGMQELFDEINSSLFSHIHIILGASGTGKTSLINMIAKHNNLDLKVFDAGVKRSLKYIIESFTTFIQFGKNKGVFFDEFEIVFTENIGAQALLNELNKYCGFPIFIALNTKFNIKLQKILSHKLKFKVYNIINPSRTIIINKCIKLYKGLDKRIIQEVVDKKYPDIRSILNYFNMPVVDVSQNIFEIDFKEIFKFIINKSTYLDIKLLQCKKDLFTMIPIMHENYLKMTPTHSHSVISENISISDVYHTKIYDKQDWHMSYLPAVCGILLPSLHVKMKNNTCISYGSILSKMSNFKTKEKTCHQLLQTLEVDTNLQLKCIHLLNSNIDKSITTKLNLIYL